MRVTFYPNEHDKFELDVPTIFPDMQVTRQTRDDGRHLIYQVVNVRLETAMGTHRSAREEVDGIVAFVSPRGTTGRLT
jgi:hypothetical protein